MNEINKKTWFRIFLVAAGCIVLYWLLHATDSVNRFFQNISAMFSPFAVGAAFAFVFNVPMRAIERGLKKVKSFPIRRTMSIIITMVAIFLVITLVFWLLIPQLSSTFDALIPQVIEFFDNLGVMIGDILEKNPEAAEWLAQNTDLENINWGVIVQNIISMVGKSFSAIASQTFSAIGSVTGFFMNLFISFVFAIYCLFQKEALARQGKKVLYAFMPERFADGSVRILHLANSTFSNFLSGQCVEVIILGGMFAIGMAIFQMPYIALVSVLVAVTAFIPLVGAWIGCICGAFLILVDDPAQAFWFVILFLVIQQIEGNMIYPKVVGSSIGLPSMWVLLSVALGGHLMGIAGMFLMIPAVSVMYTIFKEYTNLRLEKRQINDNKLKPKPPEAPPEAEVKPKKKSDKEVKDFKNPLRRKK